ncbi:hypothetical protein EVAR_62399_1 [Eumeta japonica]|uniref:Uncharacterized protein n=1 Tax=Eumeta variegata TaxID=151549 RepID=A0A4C1ZBG9_EUMVA|nr:hypothetical protein EVAR_62399_1 [Eumeta japonica]
MFKIMFFEIIGTKFLTAGLEEIGILLRDRTEKNLIVKPCVVILLRVYWRKVTRARRTASADWWITPGTAGMRPRDLFTTSRDYRESVGVIFH